MNGALSHLQEIHAQTQSELNKFNQEKQHIQSLVREEFELQLDAQKKEIQQLEGRLRKLAAEHRTEIDQMQKHHADAITKLNIKVKSTLGQKNESIEALRVQCRQLEIKCANYSEILQEQQNALQ